MAEDSSGHPSVRKSAEIIGVRQIVGDRSGFGIGHMFEFELGADVAQSPDSGSCPPELIDDNLTPIAKGDASNVKTESFGIGLPTGRNQELVAQDSSFVFEVDNDPCVAGADPFDGAIEMEVPSLRHFSREAPGNIRVEGLQHRLALSDDMDANPQA